MVKINIYNFGCVAIHFNPAAVYFRENYHIYMSFEKLHIINCAFLEKIRALINMHYTSWVSMQFHIKNRYVFGTTTSKHFKSNRKVKKLLFRLFLKYKYSIPFHPYFLYKEDFT